MASTSITNLNTHYQQKNLIGTAPNVVVSPKARLNPNHNPSTWQTHEAIYDTLKPIVTLHPEWQFKTTNYNNNVVTGFVITREEEELGGVRINYHGRNYKIEISNDRVSKSMRRGNAKYTEDPVKAQKLIRQFFFPKVKDERIEEAQTSAASTINSEAWDKDRMLSKATTQLMEYSQEFIEANLDTYVGAYPGVAKHVPAYEKAKMDMRTVEDIKKAFNDGNHVLVVLDGAEYIVRQGNVANVYNNDTLPENLRAKIGMLKLVEPEQMISNIGCKVSATVLVLVGVEAAD